MSHASRRVTRTERYARQRSLRSRRKVAAVAVTTGLLVPGIAAGETYDVEPGETLSQIAARTGVDAEAIAAANALEDPNVVRSGASLVLPLPGTALDHQVESGETVWDIANRYRLPVDTLTEANGLTQPDLVIEGSTLQVPAESVGTVAALPTVAETLTTQTPDAEPASRSTHEVVEGDTLWSIAVLHDTSLGALLGANELTAESFVRPGDQLEIPAPGEDVAPAPTPAAEQSATESTTTLPQALVQTPYKMNLMADFDLWAARYGIAPDLLKALAWWESGWDNNQRSSAGAIGIGQILPLTADFVNDQLLGASLDPTDPHQNIQLSARYIRYLLDNTGNERLAIAAYYQGLSAVRAQGVFPVSQAYIDGVQSLRSRFR